MTAGREEAGRITSTAEPNSRLEWKGISKGKVNVKGSIIIIQTLFGLHPLRWPDINSLCRLHRSLLHVVFLLPCRPLLISLPPSFHPYPAFDSQVSFPFIFHLHSFPLVAPSRLSHFVVPGLPQWNECICRRKMKPSWEIRQAWSMVWDGGNDGATRDGPKEEREGEERLQRSDWMGKGKGNSVGCKRWEGNSHKLLIGEGIEVERKEKNFIIIMCYQ